MGKSIVETNFDRNDVKIKASPELQGRMQVRDVFGAWQSRYVLQVKNFLIIFPDQSKSANTANAICRIDLSKCLSVHTSQADVGAAEAMGFVLIGPNNKVFCIIEGNEATKVRWLQSMARAIATGRANVGTDQGFEMDSSWADVDS